MVSPRGPREEIGKSEVPALDEIGGEIDAGGDDFVVDRSYAAAGKIPAAIFEGDRKTRFSQPLRQAAIARIFRIDEDAVAIEDDKLGQRHQALPVEPKPPVPRVVPPARLRSSTAMRVTAAKTT